MSQIQSSTHAGDVAHPHSPVSAHPEAEPQGNHRPGATSPLRQLQQNRQLVRTAIRALRAEAQQNVSGAARSSSTATASSTAGGVADAADAAESSSGDGLAAVGAGLAQGLGTALGDARSSIWAGSREAAFSEWGGRARPRGRAAVDPVAAPAA